jgi:hypothetical protein
MQILIAHALFAGGAAVLLGTGRLNLAVPNSGEDHC